MHKDTKYEIQGLARSMKLVTIEEETKGFTWEDDGNDI
jgi:hypothetical protein